MLFFVSVSSGIPPICIQSKCGGNDLAVEDEYIGRSCGEWDVESDENGEEEGQRDIN